MKWLLDNPILVAHLRLVWRTGHLVPAVVVFGLVYATILLSGVDRDEPAEIALLENLRRWDVLWVLLVQGMSLALGSFSKISRDVQEDRQEGILDFHRISPVPPSHILAGYLVGAPVREWLLGVMGGLAALTFVWRGEMSFRTWAAVQGLMFSTALLAQVAGMFVGQTLRRRGPVVLGAIGFVLLMMPNSFASGTSLLNFVVPSTALMYLFEGDLPLRMSRFFMVLARPRFFGQPCNPLLLTWLVQAVLALLAGLAVWRRLRDPESPALSRGEAVGLFLFLSVAQFGLIVGARWLAGVGTLMASLSLALGAGGVILFGQTAQPWRMRKLFRRRRKEQQPHPRFETAVGWAALFAAVTTVLMAVALLRLEPRLRPTTMQFGPAMAFIAAGLSVVFIGLVLIIESFRLWLARRSPGFQGLALFVLWVLPVIAGMFFGDRMEIMALSPLVVSPMLLKGLTEPWWLDPQDLVAIGVGLTAQWIAVACAGALWWRQRQRLRAALEREIE